MVYRPNDAQIAAEKGHKVDQDEVDVGKNRVDNEVNMVESVRA